VLTSANLTRLAHAGALPWDAPDARAPLAAIGVGLAEFGHWVALVRAGPRLAAALHACLPLGLHQGVRWPAAGTGLHGRSHGPRPWWPSLLVSRWLVACWARPCGAP